MKGDLISKKTQTSCVVAAQAFNPMCVTMALVSITAAESDQYSYCLCTEVFTGQTVFVTPAQLCFWSLTAARDNTSIKNMAGPASRTL